MTRPSSPKVCIYCGSTADMSVDHVPPRCLFATPPTNAITVPSCRRCNGGAAKDDEYFRFFLVAREGGNAHPELGLLSDKVVRSLDNPNAPGLLKSTLASLIDTEIGPMPGGMYVGWIPAFAANMDRVRRVAKRIILGLFFHESGRPLPKTHFASAVHVEGLKDADRERRELLLGKCAAVQSGPAKVVGQDVFAYWFDRDAGDPDSTFWVLEFYKTFRFIGATGAIARAA